MTEAVTSRRCTTADEADLPPALLRYLGNLLGGADFGSASLVLRELARLFAARGAGVAYPARTATTSEISCWIGEEQPVSPMGPLVAEGRRDLTTLQDQGGSWQFWFAPPAGN